jgi:hypothetical protein
VQRLNQASGGCFDRRPQHRPLDTRSGGRRGFWQRRGSGNSIHGWIKRQGRKQAAGNAQCVLHCQNCNRHAMRAVLRKTAATSADRRATAMREPGRPRNLSVDRMEENAKLAFGKSELLVAPGNTFDRPLRKCLQTRSGRAGFVSRGQGTVNGNGHKAQRLVC